MGIRASIDELEAISGHYHEPPAGFHWEWVEEGPDWRLLLPNTYKNCRQPQCGLPARAELNRGRRVMTGRRVDSWWAYCASHLYGRRIRAGKIELARLLRDRDSQ